MFPTPQAKMFFFAAALMLSVLVCGSGASLAQNSVRGAASPVPLTFPDAPGEAARPAAGAAAPAGKTAEPQPKFPNKDTAKNRQDYEMGTDTGSIQLGRDDATGDTVMGHTPPKKVQEPYPLEQQPIQVWPVVPIRRR
ncbi:MAG: hypothetical protein Q8O35_10285 [Humidesulfovibrio sp.]|uniref:hypothetical protein n=1 Tax=Humidesulfovibrio sp. TaxID=2910988 RepID=UPI002736D240|nr:hypothetical protein [Humidesulfovibrio sp.]MDP2848565.1 hypothetical protein [Humidesulfovibrio sp.]